MASTSPEEKVVEYKQQLIDENPDFKDLIIEIFNNPNKSDEFTEEEKEQMRQLGIDPESGMTPLKQLSRQVSASSDMSDYPEPTMNDLILGSMPDVPTHKIRKDSEDFEDFYPEYDLNEPITRRNTIGGKTRKGRKGRKTRKTKKGGKSRKGRKTRKGRKCKKM
jgi:hypothetical protein